MYVVLSSVNYVRNELFISLRYYLTNSIFTKSIEARDMNIPINSKNGRNSQDELSNTSNISNANNGRIIDTNNADLDKIASLQKVELIVKTVDEK